MTTQETAAMRRRWVLASIESYVTIEGHAPTLREIAADVGIPIPSVQGHVNALTKQGKIKTIPGRWRNIRLAA